MTERVDFTPTVTGPVSALWANTGDDNGGRQDVTFTGNGTAAPAPTISISDLDVNRPSAGTTTTAVVQVHLSSPSSTAVTAKYVAKDGTALAPTDYTATTGTVTFPAGATSATIPVVINGAAPAPTAKTLTVNLSAPNGAAIADPSAKLYLNTTYLPVSIAAGDATGSASTGGTTDLTFPVTVTPAPPVGQPVTVNASTADGTALAASGDYTPVSTSLTFTSTTQTQNVTVHLLHNPVAGSTKTVLLNLNTASTGSQIGDASGLGTVYTNTQPAPALSVSDTALVRPATGTAAATFTVSLSRPATTPASVKYAAAAGTGFTTADFVATNGTLTFQPGVTSQTVTVPINGSATSVGTGNVNLNLSGQTGATIADSGGKAYVVSPVAHSFVSVRPATAWRSPSDDTTVNVPITLDAPAPTDITIPVSTVDGTAKAGVDYSATQTSVTIPAGSSQAFLPVTIKGIAAVSPTVAFSVVLGTPAGATQVSSGTATVTIVSHTADATIPTTPSPPMFTSSSVPTTAQVGQLYNATVSASGVPEPAYGLTSGKLPTGLTLNARTGQLSGTPTTAGTYTFTLGASNTVGDPASTGPLQITVVASNAPAAFTASTPPTSSKVGTPFTYTFAASGNPNPAFALASGTLPPGIGLDPASGILSGSATTAGTYTFTVSATNGVGSPAVTGPITIAVSAGDSAPAFTNASPPSAAVGGPYSYAFTASGSPTPTFSVASGTLPAGLTLSGSGLLSGTPTTAGTSTFTVKATNAAGGAVTGAITMTVTGASGAPVITAGTPTSTGTVGKAYSFTFKATGTPAPAFAVRSGTLPPGVTLATSGVLSGTPTVDGTFSFQVGATNSAGSDTTGPLTITVSKAAASPKFTASKPPTTASVGSSYSYTFVASGSPTPTYGLASGMLPTGLSLNTTTGVLSGSLTGAGTYQFRISAANSAGTATTSAITVKVSAQPVLPVITSGTPPATGTVGTPYTFTFTATGQPAPTFKLASGALPAGLKLSSGGALAGTPTKAGTSSFSVKATNSTGSTTSTVYAITTSK